MKYLKLVLLLIMALSFACNRDMFRLFRTETEGTMETVDYPEYILNTIGVDLRDITEGSNGIMETEDGETYMMIELTLNLSDTMENREELMRRTGMALGEPLADKTPIRTGGKIMRSLKEKEILAAYHKFISGNHVKTKDVNVYIACDAAGKLYFYYFD